MVAPEFIIRLLTQDGLTLFPCDDHCLSEINEDYFDANTAIVVIEISHRHTAA